MKLEYYKNLDGIRAIAALMVIFFHFFHEMNTDIPSLLIIKKIASIGQTGVTLFFVLSGFLITRILINTKNTSGYFKNFYLRRTLRIFPLYYLFLFIYFFIAPLFLSNGQFYLADEFYYFSYLQGFARTFEWGEINGPNHFWSLAVEEHFYLFWPFVIYASSKKNVGRIVLGIVILAWIIRAIMLSNNYSVFLFTFTRIDSLAIGAVLALLELKSVLKVKNLKYFLGLFSGLIILTLYIWFVLSGEGNNFIQNFRYLLLSLVYFSLIGTLLCIPKAHFVNKLLKSKFFLYTGKVSYGLYVYHPLVFLTCAQYFSTNSIVLNLFIGTILSYLVAGLSYTYFESQFLRLKKYFEYNKTNTLVLKENVSPNS